MSSGCVAGTGFFAGRRVTVTGGASFIGSHIAAALLGAGARVRVADDYSSGEPGNLREIAGHVEALELDLRSPAAAAKACDGAELVFHLAAVHGGRGYIDSHPAACAENLLIDQHVFRAAVAAGVEKVVFASSACVYPAALQRGGGAHRVLSEDLVGPPYEPDGIYGLAKLCGELVLDSLSAEHGIHGLSCRYFTAYGPHCGESHAVMAMIARAFVGSDPFEIWGDGSQVRTWIYIDDLVRMTLLAAERVERGVLNVATTEAHTVREAAKLVLQVTGHRARIATSPERPTGPHCRIASIERATALLGTGPQIGLAEGIRRTAEWYYDAKDRRAVFADLESLLVERRSSGT